MAGELAVINAPSRAGSIEALKVEHLAEPDSKQKRVSEPSIIVSLLIHLMALAFGFVNGGVQGVPGPGGGKVMYFELAKGEAHDVTAAPLAPAKPKPVVTPPKKEAPKAKEKPKAKVPTPPRPKPVTDEYSPQKKYVKPEPTEEETTPQPQKEMTLEEELSGAGVPGGMGRGGGGEAVETILNKKGNSLTGGMIMSQMTGRTMKLNVMGRDDIQGGNNTINTVIKLNPDGTSDITLTHYFFQTYHEQYSSTRSESAKGHWWVEGNRWCHQSEAINYGTKDCYDMTTEGATIRLYYAPCSIESSALCKSGRRAAIGQVE